MRVLRVYVGYLLLRVYVGYLLLRVYVGYLLLRVYVWYLLVFTFEGVFRVYTLRVYVGQGRPDRGPRAQIWAPDRLFLGPLGLKYMH